MEHINSPMNRIMRGQCASSTTKPQTEDNVITRLFAVLGVLYGSRFTSLIQNDEAENAARLGWGKALAGIEVDVIAAALDRLPTEYPDWPPTIGQFLAVTKIGRDPTMQPALPKPRGSEEVALSACDEIYKILGVK